MGGHESSLTGYWSHGRSTRPVGALSGYQPPHSTPRSAPHVCSTRPLSQNPTSLLESSPEPYSTDSAGHEAQRNPLGEIQGPELLILRTSHHRTEAEIMTLSTFQPPFLSPEVASVGVGNSAAIFTLRFPELPTNLGYRTPQSMPLHPQQSQETSGTTCSCARPHSSFPRTHGPSRGAKCQGLCWMESGSGGGGQLPWGSLASDVI